MTNKLYDNKKDLYNEKYSFLSIFFKETGFSVTHFTPPLKQRINKRRNR